MSDMQKRYELTVSLSFANSPVVRVDQVARQLEESLQHVLKEYAAVTAYFVSPQEAEVEIVVGLRFEGMHAKYIRETADEILKKSMSTIVSSSGSGFEATLEESTLIPA
jgi:hypothetical protein